MNQRNIIQLLAGANKVAKATSEIINEKGANYIEENLLKGNYVTRSEFDQLKNLVKNLEKKISENVE
jgi:hypothetical protein